MDTAGAVDSGIPAEHRRRRRDGDLSACARIEHLDPRRIERAVFRADRVAPGKDAVACLVIQSVAGDCNRPLAVGDIETVLPGLAVDHAPYMHGPVDRLWHRDNVDVNDLVEGI